MQTATAADIKIGTRLQNNDPRARANGQPLIVTVNSLLHHVGLVGYRASTRQAWIKLDRIYTDGKDRHQGYNLTTDTPL